LPSPPGALDTSFIASDNVNNPRTINAVFNVAARLETAEEELATTVDEDLRANLRGSIFLLQQQLALINAPDQLAAEPLLVDRRARRQREGDDLIPQLSWQLGLQQLAPDQQRAHLLGIGRLAVHGAEPAHPQQLGDAAGVLAVGLDHHRRQRRLHMSCFPLGILAADAGR
jgi:hypothetical protein